MSRESHPSHHQSIPPTPWWDIAKHRDRRPALITRGRIKSALRAHFEAAGFTEVEPGALQPSPGNEAHLHAFATTLRTESGQSHPVYLHTSPEFAMKKLLAAGETRIFTFAPVYRNRERGVRHAPEFTMLEWYRVGEPYTAIQQDCTDIVRIAADVSGNPTWRYGSYSVSALLPPTIITVAEAFRRYAEIDVLATLDGADADRDALARQVAAQGIRVAADDTWTDLFSRVLAVRIEPALAGPGASNGAPVILTDYPAHEAALARKSAHDPRVAERFELYAAGVELANCFGELTDPVEQRQRFETEMGEKQRVYGERYPIDEDFLSALAYMPAASGGALGFDRLVMLATGAPSIDHVQWTPFVSD